MSIVCEIQLFRSCASHRRAPLVRTASWDLGMVELHLWVWVEGLFPIAVSVVRCVSGWCDWARGMMDEVLKALALLRVGASKPHNSGSHAHALPSAAGPIIHRVTVTASVSTASLLPHHYPQAQLQTFVSYQLCQLFHTHVCVFAWIMLCGRDATSLDLLSRPARFQNKQMESNQLLTQGAIWLLRFTGHHALSVHASG